MWPIDFCMTCGLNPLHFCVAENCKKNANKGKESWETCLVRSEPSSLFTTGRHAKAQASVRCCVDVGAVVQQQLHHVLVAFRSCNIKEGPTSATHDQRHPESWAKIFGNFHGAKSLTQI